MTRAAPAPGGLPFAALLSRERLGPLATWALGLGGVVALALEKGGYPTTVWTAAAILVWWALGLALALGLWKAPPRPIALAAGGLLAAFTLWTGLSIAWADSAGRAFLELDRAALYLGIFWLAVLLAGGGTRRSFCDGLATGIVAISVLSLLSRFFPHLVHISSIYTAFGAANSRLTYPLDYWNGLAIFAGLGPPLLLRTATAGRTPLVRGLAAAPLPALAAVIYLTSSRGGALVAVVGVVCFLLLTDRRYRAVSALVCGGLGAGGAVAVLLARDELVDGTGTSHQLASQGRSAAFLVALLCLLAGALHAALTALSPERARPAPRALRVAVAVAVLIAIAAGTAAANPSKRFDHFKQKPDVALGSRGHYVREHFLSGGSSGRWQFWGAAVDQFQAHPLVGHGAGSYEAWWAQHAPIRFFARDAHSLYLETLAELGLLGALLLVAALGVALAGGLSDRLRARDGSRSTLAAATAAGIAFLVAAGIDWMWELTAVGAIGIACLGLMAGGSAPERTAANAPSRRRLALRLGVVAVALVLVACQGLVFLSESALRHSQKEARAGNLGSALDDARDARALEPWAASPYLQLALVREQAGDLRAAHDQAEKATRRDPRDWRAWLTRARISTKTGAIGDARRSYLRAKALNHTSPLFETGKSGAR